VTPEYLAQNPNGKVPMLVDGDVTLWPCSPLRTPLSSTSRRRDFTTGRSV
jgi:hypothetical protein